MSVAQALADPSLYAQLVRYVSARSSGDVDAEDVVQEIFLKLLRAEVPPLDDPRAWLFRVARNAVVDVYRRRASAAARAPHAHEPEPHGASPEDTDTDAIARYTAQLIGSLGGRDQEVLSAIDLAGASQRAYALAHGVPYATVKSWVQRARARLRRELEARCELTLDGRGVPIACAPRVPSCCS